MNIGAVTSRGFAGGIISPKTTSDESFDINSIVENASPVEKGKTIGLMTVGNLVYLAKYADSSTLDNPVVKIGDNEISVKDVNPSNATEMEMCALMSYLDDVGASGNHGMSSFSKMKAYGSQAEYNGVCSGIYDADSVMTKKQNWMEIIKNAKNIFASIPATYAQASNCENMLNAMENGLS
jgi:hypothetical protein